MSRPEPNTTELLPCPTPVPAGKDSALAVERLGRSSITYRIGLFQGEGDLACAEGRFVHVYVDACPVNERRERR